jgi:transposase
VLKTPTRWEKLSMISAISARGGLAFKIVEGAINTDRFIEFLEGLVQDARQKIFLIVDNLRVHHAKKVTAWLSDTKSN